MIGELRMKNVLRVFLSLVFIAVVAMPDLCAKEKKPRNPFGSKASKLEKIEEDIKKENGKNKPSDKKIEKLNVKKEKAIEDFAKDYLKKKSRELDKKVASYQEKIKKIEEQIEKKGKSSDTMDKQLSSYEKSIDKLETKFKEKYDSNDFVPKEVMEKVKELDETASGDGEEKKEKKGGH